MAQRSWIRHAAPTAERGPFEAQRTGAGNEVVLRGELDAYTAPHLDEVLSEVAGQSGDQRIVVDLGGLSFIDVTGVGMLVSANNGAPRRGTELVLRSPSSQTLKLLEITGLNTVFTIE